MTGTPQPSREPGEVRLRKYEALYAYSTDTYSKEIERLDAIEQKATQHLSLLTILLGLNTAGFADFIASWKECTTAADVYRWSFVFLTLSNLSAFIAFLRVLVLMKVPERRADDAMPAFFNSTRYATVLFSMSNKFLHAARILRARVDRKVSYTRIGIVILLIAIGFAVVCGSSYTIMKTREAPHVRPEGTEVRPAQH